MASVGQQMPRLFLRGSLCNQTMRNLTPEQVQRIEAVMLEVDSDSMLKPTKHQFMSALANTIGGDYRSDPKAAEQEFFVALYRAATAATMGWGKHQPVESTLTDPIQKKKFFQTFVFNYLRQILQENKRVMTTMVETKTISILESITSKIENLISGAFIKTRGEDSCVISCNLYEQPSQSILNLQRLISEAKNENIEISITNKSISLKNNGIRKSVEVQTTKTVRVGLVSTSTNDDDRSDYDIEDVRSFNQYEAIHELKKQLPEVARQIVEIMLDPPHEYIKRFNTTKPHQKYIMEFLNLKPKEIKQAYSIIRLKYVQIVGCPSRD